VLDLGTSSMVGGNSFISTYMGYPVNYTEVGMPIGSFYGWIFEGIYQNQAEIDTHLGLNSGKKPGDPKFKHLTTADGTLITDADRTWLGNSFPEYTFGFNNTFSWKGLSVSIFITGNMNFQIANLNRYQMNSNNLRNQFNQAYESYINRWTYEGSTNLYPASPAFSSQVYFDKKFSSFFIEDGTYVRLQNLMISYDLPIKSISPIIHQYIRNIKLYVSGSNLYTLTKYSWFDPSVSSKSGSSLSPGIDYGAVPIPRTFSLGANFSF
jgi:hypothetical protein